MFGSLCLAAALFTAPVVSHTPGQEIVYAATDKSGLYHEGDSWNYYEDGQIAADKTTLVKYNGSWWYIRNGKIDFSSTTLCRYGESQTRTYSDGTTERLYDWYYVHGGKVDFSARTLCKYNGTWWFVESGKVNYDDNTLVKYGNNWYLVMDGKVEWNQRSRIVKFNGHEYEVRNGIVDFSAGVDYYVYNDSMITYVSGCPYPLYKIFYDDRGYPYFYGKWGGPANMDADNLHKTEACLDAIGDYMLYEKGFSYIMQPWRSLGTYDEVSVVVRYIQIPGETDSLESYGIPF